MADRLRVACVQLNAGADKPANLEKAERLVARAAATGADVVVLPEKWNAIGGPDVFRANAETVESGETFAALSSWARRHGVTIVGGSVTERRDGREKLSNTCPVYDPHGELVGLYRKIHMFDVEVGGQVYRESEAEEPGEEPVVCEAEGWKLGLTVCYDLRFPELFRIEALEGAELITVPAAFTLFTGKDHWELLLRARAVENQLYVAASNQWMPEWVSIDIVGIDPAFVYRDQFSSSAFSHTNGVDHPNPRSFASWIRHSCLPVWASNAASHPRWDARPTPGRDGSDESPAMLPVRKVRRRPGW